MDKQLRISLISLSLSTSLGFLLYIGVEFGSTEINGMPILAICATLRMRSITSYSYLLS